METSYTVQKSYLTDCWVGSLSATHVEVKDVGIRAPIAQGKERTLVVRLLRATETTSL